VTTIKKALENETRDYKHYDKFVEPDEHIKLGDTTLKWYNLAKADEPVPNDMCDLAHDFLKKEFEAGNLKDFGKLGFVILHRCGNDFYFLLASSWKNGNELWESVYAKTSSDEEDFQIFTFENNLHRGTFCVWELAAVWHEQQAWRRFLLSEKTAEDESNYLHDKYRGKA
jgi:hypothetical protein